jgi:hypothetical protein
VTTGLRRFAKRAAVTPPPSAKPEATAPAGAAAETDGLQFFYKDANRRKLKKKTLYQRN